MHQLKKLALLPLVPTHTIAQPLDLNIKYRDLNTHLGLNMLDLNINLLQLL